MRDLLVDLYRHQEWADAELWRAYEKQAGALQDKALWERLYHIHVVQQAFLVIARELDPRSIKFKNPSSYESPRDLRLEAQRYHVDVHEFLKGADAETLERPIRVPWFKDPPLEIAMGQALLQAAMHSHYHRGQNATRLRELGGEPPPTDYIVWLWKGKPQAEWA